MCNAIDQEWQVSQLLQKNINVDGLAQGPLSPAQQNPSLGNC